MSQQRWPTATNSLATYSDRLNLYGVQKIRQIGRRLRGGLYERDSAKPRE